MLFNRRKWLLALILVGILGTNAPVSGDELPVVTNIERQPLEAQVRRLVSALEVVGRPLSGAEEQAIQGAIELNDDRAAILAIQEVLDPHCLVGVSINPESRVKAAKGAAAPILLEQGWTAFLVKVHNEAGVTAPLRVQSPNAAPVYQRSSGRPDPEPTIPLEAIRDRWLDVAMFDTRPLNPTLSGLGLEYRIIELFSRDAGPREGKLSFDVGQGTQDLGFRSDVDILFNCRPGITVAFDVRDEDGTPTMGSFLIRDERGRIYPSPSRRLAPDFFFHPQIYRGSGESVTLPPGNFSVEYTRGPEYLVKEEEIEVEADSGTTTERFVLTRWANLASMGWYSGDHHIHAAGCAHYESPSEGVQPEDMMRHILGEDLTVGCVLSWGPCWYFQKQFFDGSVHPLSTDDYLMRYDVEVSGFPSSHSGHLCLIRLTEDDYPGTTLIEEWPSWDLPVLQWGKSQDAVVGFSHSGWGLQTVSNELPNYEIPPFDGIGANEYIVDVVHDAVDFISTVDTPAPYELNIWYHTLNCGFRCRISGETDFPCIYGERVGLGRSYVKVDGALDYDRWADGIRDGRCYVSDGKSHLVNFKVDDVALGEDGSELRLEAPGKVTVSAEVAAYLPPTLTDEAIAIRNRPLNQKPYWDIERARIEESRTVPLELVVNGYPVARQDIEADGEFQEVSFDVELDQSSWVALRIYPSSHTNPIFVVIDDQPIRASKRSAQWCLESVDRCWKSKVGNIRPADRPDAERAFDVARAAYRQIFAESSAD